jgi:hypothetical protein
MHAGQDPGDEKSQIQALDRTAPILPLRLRTSANKWLSPQMGQCGKDDE